MVHTTMRFFLVSLLFAAVIARAEEATPAPESGAPATAAILAAPEGTPPLLAAAYRPMAADAERWAYTQTVVSKDRDGKVKEETVVRFDPSLPFEEQWTPLRQDGSAPTERQIRQLRSEHEKRRKQRRPLGELLDLPKATVAEETAATVTYEVPLIQNDNQRLPPEKFRVTARVSKDHQVLENVAVRLREPLRVKLIFKLKAGEADMDFTSVNPQFAPPITSLRADGEGSILFVRVGGNYSATRTDFKRVKPYSERFKVRLAPLQFLDY
jgi:hypothetical protein